MDMLGPERLSSLQRLKSTGIIGKLTLETSKCVLYRKCFLLCPIGSIFFVGGFIVHRTPLI